jgi:hypothetical protein
VTIPDVVEVRRVCGGGCRKFRFADEISVQCSVNALF